jgi:hypothetical protein
MALAFWRQALIRHGKRRSAIINLVCHHPLSKRLPNKNRRNKQPYGKGAKQ